MRFTTMSLCLSVAVTAFVSSALMAQEVNMPLNQLDAINGALQSQRPISKREVLDLFQIRGDGVIKGHQAYGKNPDGTAKTSTIYSFTAPAIPISTELQRVDIEAIDNSSQVLRLTFYPQKGACINSSSLVERYGLSRNTESSEPNPGANSIAYTSALKGGNLDIYVPASSVHGMSCVSEVHVFANMR